MAFLFSSPAKLFRSQTLNGSIINLVKDKNKMMHKTQELLAGFWL